jgi:hypothetical protein
VLVNGLTSVVLDTSGTKQTPYLRHLENLLNGNFIKGESAFATELLASFRKLLCITSYANLSAKS